MTTMPAYDPLNPFPMYKGAPLARLVANIGLSLLLQRLSDIQIASEVPLQPVAHGFHGVRSLPVTFHVRR